MTTDQYLHSAIAAVGRWRAGPPTHDSYYQKWVIALVDEVERLRGENENVRVANIEGSAWVDCAKQDIARMTTALRQIIDMNIQYAKDRYGDASKAESMACVKVAREALP